MRHAELKMRRFLEELPERDKIHKDTIVEHSVTGKWTCYISLWRISQGSRLQCSVIAGQVD